jgi:hypothetical protein
MKYTNLGFSPIIVIFWLKPYKINQQKEGFKMKHVIFLRRMLYTGSGLIVLSAIILAFIVIPSVRTDTFPRATPERAAMAFWVNVVIKLLIVAALSGIILAHHRGNKLNKGLLITSGVILALLGLSLIDAAFAFSDHGPDMQSSAVLLFVCVCCDLVAAVIVLTTPFLKPKKADSF